MSIIVEEPLASEVAASTHVEPTDHCKCCLPGGDQETLRCWLLDVARRTGTGEDWNGVVGSSGRLDQHGSTLSASARRGQVEVFAFMDDQTSYIEAYREAKARRNSTDRRQIQEEVNRLLEEMRNKLERKLSDGYLFATLWRNMRKRPSTTSPRPKHNEEAKYFQILAPNESPLRVQGLVPPRRISPGDAKSQFGPTKTLRRTTSCGDALEVVGISGSKSVLHGGTEDGRAGKSGLSMSVPLRHGGQPAFSHFSECLQRSRRARSSSSNAASSSLRGGLRLAVGPRAAELEAQLQHLWPYATSAISSSSTLMRSHTTLGLAERQSHEINCGSVDTRNQLALPRISRALRRSFQQRAARANTAGSTRQSLRREPFCVIGPSILQTRVRCLHSAKSTSGKVSDGE